MIFGDGWMILGYVKQTSPFSLQFLRTCNSQRFSKRHRRRSLAQLPDALGLGAARSGASFPGKTSLRRRGVGSLVWEHETIFVKSSSLVWDGVAGVAVAVVGWGLWWWCS